MPWSNKTSNISPCHATDANFGGRVVVVVVVVAGEECSASVTILMVVLVVVLLQQLVWKDLLEHVLLHLC
jgi:hypothetical protein